ncbi:MAG: protein phosphatase 2C domain-containing protein [Nitrospirae bacterium]|nr:protein phosphatase 2C domain-containing protein [Nitrospirota bacterium]
MHRHWHEGWESKIDTADNKPVCGLRAYGIQKNGSPPEDYEDAYGFNKDAMCVADGATESIFSREFANMLVDSFISSLASEQSGLRQIMQTVIEKAGSQWSELLLTRTLPWYAELKAAQGSHAAFTGIRLSPASPPASKKRLFFQKAAYRWEAVGVGDVCLIIVRDDELIKAFPVKSAAEFDNSPNLISSLDGPGNTHIETTSGELRQGDTVFLLSDALAEWFYKSHENGLFPWKTLGKINSEVKFRLLIERLRAAKQIKNDDATAIFITPGKLPR